MSLSGNIKFKFCPTCGDPFFPSSEKKVYCSEYCKPYQQRIKAKKIEEKINEMRKKDEDKKSRYFPGFHKLRFEIFKRDNFTCQYCGRNVKKHKVVLHLDHIVPFSKKGKNNKKNFITSCFDCNIGKFDNFL